MCGEAKDKRKQNATHSFSRSSVKTACVFLQYSHGRYATFPSSGFTRCYGTDGQRVGGGEGQRDVGFLIYDSAIFHRRIAVSLHRLAFQQIPSMFGFD
ncbi:uncharacterized [Tachysurus ichikawai]